jgi:hypothetical protein
VTDPILSYQSASPTLSPLRAGLWITVLVLGILYCLAGSCIGSSFALSAHDNFEDGGTAFESLTPFTMALLAIQLLGMLVSGGIFIWAAIAIRRRLRAGAVMALTVAFLNTVAIAILIAIAIAQSFRDPSPVWSIIAGLAFYGFAALADTVVACFLWQLLRREHQWPD